MNTLVLTKGARISEMYSQFFVKIQDTEYSYLASIWEDMKKKCSLQLIPGHTSDLLIVLMMSTNLLCNNH